MNISVVIPAHNSAKWLPKCLESVNSQTFDAEEIIVANDSSTDQTQEVLTSCQDKRLIIIEVDFHNAAQARNRGIQEASGDWIAFLDADDFWYPNHLERATNLLKNSRSIAYISHADIFSDVDEKILQRTCPWPYLEPTKDLSSEDFIKVCSKKTSLHTPSMVVSRKRLLAVGGFDPAQKRRHDIEMWLRLVYGRQWCYDPVATLAYRYDTPGSISRANEEARYYLARALIKNLERYQSRAMYQWARNVSFLAAFNAYLFAPQLLNRFNYEAILNQLSKTQKAILRLACFCPKFFRWAKRQHITRLLYWNLHSDQ